MKSPNYSKRKSPLQGVVLHYTAAGNYLSSARWLCNPAAKASAHVVIGRKGEVVELVSKELKAWHAGIGEMYIKDKGVLSNPNDFTYGIELANYGNAYVGDYGKHADLKFDNGGVVSGYWEQYPQEQIDALKGVLEQFPESIKYNIMGHDEIAMPLCRKNDVGPLFPWEQFTRYALRRTRGILTI